MARFTERYFLVAGPHSPQLVAVIEAIRLEGGHVAWLAPMGSTPYPSKGVLTIKANPNSTKSLQAAMARVRERSVHLHGAVNVVQIPSGEGFLVDGAKGFGQAVGAILDPLARLIHSEVGKMLESGGGSIVNVVGTDGERFGRTDALDATIRGAVESMTRSLAGEFGPNRVRVNAVVPGVKSAPEGEPPLMNPGDPRLSSPRWTLVTDAEVAAAVVSLVSDDTIALSGQVIRVA